MITWIKVGGILTAVLAVFFFGYRLGGLSSKTALEALQAAQAEEVAKAVLAERAASAAQASRDHAAESQHAKDLADIAALAPVSTPLIVYRSPPACVGAVPGTEAPARALAADPAGGGGERVGGAVDLRPGIEALKKRLEDVMADYRELAAEWPK